MKHSLIILAALTGAYFVSGDMDRTQPVKSAEAVPLASQDAPGAWQIYSRAHEKPCRIEGDIDSGQLVKLDEDCSQQLHARDGLVRFSANSRGYDVMSQDNTILARFGAAELAGYEAFYPEGASMILERADAHRQENH